MRVLSWKFYRIGNFTEINFDRVTVSVPIRQAKHRKTLEECGETIKDEIFSCGRKLNVQRSEIWTCGVKITLSTARS